MKKVVAVFLASLILASGLATTSGVIAENEKSDDDDTTHPEVGVEWVEHYPGNRLWWSDESASGFSEGLCDPYYAGSAFWDEEFNFGDEDAWEGDFRDPDAPASLNQGWDYLYVDNVDAVWFQGHGEWGGVFFISHMLDGRLNYGEAYWGDCDLEWIFLHACRTLQGDTAYYKDSYYSRFARSMRGVHLICGSITKLKNNAYDGHYVSWYLTRRWGPEPVCYSWYHGLDHWQPGDRILRILAEDPIFMGDYVWGQGTVYDDRTPPWDNYYHTYDYYCS